MPSAYVAISRRPASVASSHTCEGLSRSAGTRRPPELVEELNQAKLGLGSKLTKVGGLEGLDEHGRTAIDPAMLRSVSRSAGSSGRPRSRKAGRVLGLGIHTNWLPELAFELQGEHDDFVERWYAVLAIKRMRSRVEPLPGAKRLNLCKREIFCKPARDLNSVHVFRAFAVREFCGRVRCRPNFVS